MGADVYGQLVYGARFSLDELFLKDGVRYVCEYARHDNNHKSKYCIECGQPVKKEPQYLASPLLAKHMSILDQPVPDDPAKSHWYKPETPRDAVRFHGIEMSQLSGRIANAYGLGVLLTETDSHRNFNEQDTIRSFHPDGLKAQKEKIRAMLQELKIPERPLELFLCLRWSV